MKVTAKVELKHAFVLRSSDAAKIWSVLAEALGPVKASARCADDIEREFDSTDALSSYENPRSRCIRSLSFRARSNGFDASASVHLGGRFSSTPTIDLDIEGPEPTVLRVRDRLGELFDGMRPWYSVISRIDFFLVVAGMSIFLMTVLSGMSGKATDRRALGISEAVSGAAFLSALFGAVAFLIWVLNRIRNRVFPAATFAIGQGEGRHQFDEKIRWVVIIGFLVSTFASLVVAFLFRGA